MNTLFVGFGDFDAPPARVVQHLADRRDMPREHRSEAAERVDILIDFGKARVDHFADIV